MEFLLDEAPIAIKTTGEESSTIFGLGYVIGYGNCLEDIHQELGAISVPVVVAVRRLRAYTRSTAIRVRALQAYRTSL